MKDCYWVVPTNEADRFQVELEKIGFTEIDVIPNNEKTSAVKAKGTEEQEKLALVYLGNQATSLPESAEKGEVSWYVPSDRVDEFKTILSEAGLEGVREIEESRREGWIAIGGDMLESDIEGYEKALSEADLPSIEDSEIEFQSVLSQVESEDLDVDSAVDKLING